MPRCVPLLALTAVALMAGFGLAQTAGARAERPVRLALPNAETLPFAASELSAAVGLRAQVVTGADAAPDAVEVDVTSTEVGWVEVASGPRRRRVEVSGVSGPDAARLVALIVVDVVRAEMPLPAAAAVAVSLPPETTAPARGGSPSRFALAAIAGLGVRTTDAGIGMMPTLEGQLRLTNHMRIVLSAAFERAEVVVRQAPADGKVALTMFPLRLGAGLRLGWAELRAGALARLYTVSELAADGGVVWGGFAAVTAAWPTRGAVSGFGIVGVDFHPQVLALTLAQQPVLTLHTLAPFVGVGAVFGSRG